MPRLVTLSQKELHRLEAVQKIRERRLSVVQAAELLHLSRSQVHRLLQAYVRDGRATDAAARRSATRRSTWCASTNGTLP
jgi:predicted transcriptional regulator